MQPDFDGRTFGFPGADPQASLFDVLRWATTRQKTKWPRHVPNPPPTPIVPRVNDDALRATFVNHATVLIQSAGLNVLTDPVWSRRVSPSRFAGPARHRDPGIAFDALPPVDVVLVSHNHYDHMDLRTLARLRERDDPLFLVPLKNAGYLRRMGIAAAELDWWGEQALSETASATLVPSRHWSSRRLGDANRALWGGYVLRLPGGAVHFAGDSGYGDGEHFREARRRLGPFRLALLPIGAYEPRWFMRPQHMNPDEAVRALADLEAEAALAIHFGTFQLTDEGIDDPPRALAAALDAHGVPRTRFRVLEHGTAWDVG